MEVVFLECVILSVVFVILFIAKQFGISGGRISRLIPFFTIILISFIMAVLHQFNYKQMGFHFDVKITILTFVFATCAAIPYFLGEYQEASDSSVLWNGFYYLLVGTTEELFFRGYLKARFEGVNPWIWRVTSGLAFATLHMISSDEMTIILFILLLAFGMVFCLMRDVIGSVIPLIAFHFLWDFLGQYSDSYSNALYMLGAWIVLLLVAFLFRTKEKGGNVQNR